MTDNINNKEEVKTSNTKASDDDRENMKEPKQNSIKGIDSSNINSNLKLRETSQKEHLFWKTQPVRLNENDISKNKNEPIVEAKPPSEYRQTPYNLPEGYQWSNIDIKNTLILDELQKFLAVNYIESSNGKMRSIYSKEGLLWTLTIPGWIPYCIFGIRLTSSGELVGFISGVPDTISIRRKIVRTCDVDFLCIIPALRSKRLSPVLIKELTRRTNVIGFYQGIHTGVILLPNPIASPRYWHRLINVKKLIEIDFTYLPKNMTYSLYNKANKIPDHVATPGFRLMQPKDVPQVCKLLNQYNSKYKIFKVFTDEHVAHMFTPVEDVIYSYVIESKNELTDFCSFYPLETNIINNPKHNTLKRAYGYYYTSLNIPVEEIIMDLIICAKQLNFDVFSCLDIMENEKAIDKLNFHQGSGVLNYYLFNWNCPSFKKNEIAFILP